MTLTEVYNKFNSYKYKICNAEINLNWILYNTWFSIDAVRHYQFPRKTYLYWQKYYIHDTEKVQWNITICAVIPTKVCRHSKIIMWLSGVEGEEIQKIYKIITNKIRGKRWEPLPR